MRQPAVCVLLTAILALTAFPGASRAGVPVFQVDIDRDAWQEWRFRYPATYVFQLAGDSAKVEVRRRDAMGDSWSALAVKTNGDFFNGVDCVRYDRQAKRAYVSVGFRTTPGIQLEFLGAAKVEFVEVARYYDAREAACSLSIDNWGFRATAHPGAAWQGTADDRSDKYQAALHVCREFHLPVSIAINTGSAGGDDFWRTLQEELDLEDAIWEPAVHAQTHPCSAAAYTAGGYRQEILGCRDALLSRLRNIPYGQHIFEHILTCGYHDEHTDRTDAGQFLFVRGYNSHDNPTSVDYAPWNSPYEFYGIGGLSKIAYDAVFQSRKPDGRYYAEDVSKLNDAFDRSCEAGEIFYAMWHPDRYSNSVIHDSRPGIDGVQGSSLVQHLAHVANRKEIWYVANGWLYGYRYVAEYARVKRLSE